MDNSTIVFIITLVVAFVFLRWLISPIPQSVPEEFNIPDPQSRSHRNQPSAPRTRNRTSREINPSMIEVVRAIAPHLTTSQVRYSLERTGSVEATVEEYMENQSLPFPPGESPIDHGADGDAHNVAPLGETKNLIEKYGLDLNGNHDQEILETTGKWGKDKNERQQLLQKRREEMILKARRRMEKSLTNDVLSDD